MGIGPFGIFASKGEIYTPLLINLPEADALAQIDSAHLKVTVGAPVNTSDPAIGEAGNATVAEQDPHPDTTPKVPYDTNMDIRLYNFAFSPFSVFRFFGVFSFTPFSVFSFTPFSVFSFTPFSVFRFFGVFSFTPFSVFSFTPFSVFRFFGVFSFTPFSVFSFSAPFSVFSFSAPFSVFAFTPFSVFTFGR